MHLIIPVLLFQTLIPIRQVSVDGPVGCILTKSSTQGIICVTASNAYLSAADIRATFLSLPNAYKLPNLPVKGSLKVFRNGLRMLGGLDYLVDYTTGIITFTKEQAPVVMTADEIIVADYLYE
jgi:hypothetical protein